ncbi:MAG: GNAT family N-acetyltransferase [Marinoscillum sp.]
MEQVLLRNMVPEDAAKLAELANNKKIWDNVRDYFPFPYTLQHAEVFIKTQLEKEPATNLAICYKNEFVGVVGIDPKKYVIRITGMLGYWIGEPYWNKGIASAAVKLAVKYGFETLKLVRLQAGVFAYNLSSIKNFASV